MVQLLIIADDFTGGLDTGVQFAQKGIRTCVVTDPDADMKGMPEEVRVLVLVLETRHLAPGEAYQAVHACAVRAKEAGIPCVYKKTDSALRGNIGAELTAVRDALGCAVLPFLPALPGMDRVTQKGIHYIGGVPAAESVFGQDPFEPVTESDVGKLIAHQSGVPVSGCAPGGPFPDGEGIWVCDAASEEDLERMGLALRDRGLLGACAGCAGFAAFLPSLLGLKGDAEKPLPRMEDGLLVLCGSVNPITLRQMAYAEQRGFDRVHIPARDKLEKDWFLTPEGEETLQEWRKLLEKKKWVILDANDADGENRESRAFAAARGMDTEEVRRRISGALGTVMKPLLRERKGALLITGGDTLLECMRRSGVDRMEPLGQVFPGVVLAEFELDGVKRQVIAKSGGFGAETLFCDLRERIG